MKGSWRSIKWGGQDSPHWKTEIKHLHSQRESAEQASRARVFQAAETGEQSPRTQENTWDI